MDPYLAVIFLFGGNFAIKGFQLCNGQTLAISQNAALFSLIGTYYGGNGTSTFQLPDLRGRTAVQQGQGPGLSLYSLGEQTGEANATLLSANIPSHNHLVNAFNGSTASTEANSPAGAFLAEGPKAGGVGSKSPDYYTNTAPNTTLNPLAAGVNTGGGSNPFSIMQPYLAVTFLIAMQGIFPSRS